MPCLQLWCLHHVLQCICEGQVTVLQSEVSKNMGSSRIKYIPVCVSHAAHTCHTHHYSCITYMSCMHYTYHYTCINTCHMCITQSHHYTCITHVTHASHNHIPLHMYHTHVMHASPDTSHTLSHTQFCISMHYSELFKPYRFQIIQHSLKLHSVRRERNEFIIDFNSTP